MGGIHLGFEMVKFCDLTLYFCNPHEDEIYSTQWKMCEVKKK